MISSISSSEVSAMPDPRQPEQQKDKDIRHQEYESDRRGEHKYPADDSEERPSQRERDELKERLERGR